MRSLTLLALTLLALALLLPGCDSSRSGLDGGADRGAAADLPRSDWRGEGPPPGVDARPSGDASRGDTSAPPVDRCAPLAAPTGTVIKVTPAQAAQLPGIVASAASGATVLLEDGTYLMQAQRERAAHPDHQAAHPALRLRAARHGHPRRRVRDARRSSPAPRATSPSPTSPSRARSITRHPRRLRRRRRHPAHAPLQPRARRRGEQFVKVNSDGARHYVDDGRLECCSPRADRRRAARTSRPRRTGCYTGGIDGHDARGWTVRDNHFEGIYCETGRSPSTRVHFWTGSRDTLVERNVILDCARGVGFGLGDTGTGRDYPDEPYPGVGYLGHVDGIIRNNLIHAGSAAAPCFDTGIELTQARGVKVLHNTVASKPTFSSIDYRWANTVAIIRNNLTSKITERDGAAGTVDHNLESAATTLFVNAASADYHLAAAATAAIDKGVAVPEAGLDLDGKAHDVGLPDLGAYERRP